MLSIYSLTAEELNEYIESFILTERANSFINIDTIEIQNYFRIWSNDTFIMVKFKGNLNDFKQELDYVNFPRKSYGNLLIFKSYTDFNIDNITCLEDIIAKKFPLEEWHPLLCWALYNETYDTEIVLITKVFSPKNTSDDKLFKPLWDAVISDLDVSGDRSFYNSLANLNWRITNETVELYMQGMTRSELIILLKKDEIEKNIYKYTGKKLNIRIM